MIHVRFAVTTDIYFPHQFKTSSRYSSSTVGRVIYSTQIWLQQPCKWTTVFSPKAFALETEAQPLFFPLLFLAGSFSLSFPYFSVGLKVTSSPALRNVNETPCSFDTSLELFLSPACVRIHERLCLPNHEVTVALAFKPNKPPMCCERACR